MDIKLYFLQCFHIIKYNLFHNFINNYFISNTHATIRHPLDVQNMTCKVPTLYMTSKICFKDIIWTFYKDIIWTSYINYADFRNVQNMLLIRYQYIRSINST